MFIFLASILLLVIPNRVVPAILAFRLLVRAHEGDICLSWRLVVATVAFIVLVFVLAAIMVLVIFVLALRFPFSVCSLFFFVPFFCWLLLHWSSGTGGSVGNWQSALHPDFPVH